MKGTKPMVDAIKLYLDAFAHKDPVFKAKYESEKKNLEDCIQYILNQVKASGANGFHDDEIFGMAVHYYDEESIDIGKAINMTVKVNRFSLPEEDKPALIQKAKDKFEANELKKLEDKEKKRIEREKAKAKKEKEDAKALKEKEKADAEAKAKAIEDSQATLF